MNVMNTTYTYTNEILYVRYQTTNVSQTPFSLMLHRNMSYNITLVIHMPLMSNYGCLNTISTAVI